MSLEVVPREMRVAGKTAVVESDTTLVPAASLEALANRARHEHGLATKAARNMVEHAILCGEALLEARKRGSMRGTWERWVQDEAQLRPNQARWYMRIALYADLLRAGGVESIAQAQRFLGAHKLLLPDGPSDDEISQMRALRARGATIAEISDVVSWPPTTVRNYITDPSHGKRRGRGVGKSPRRAGRRSSLSKNRAITDDLVEGAAIKLREMFGPGDKNVTDSDRDAAVEILRAAFTYDGPIPGEG